MTRGGRFLGIQPVSLAPRSLRRRFGGEHVVLRESRTNSIFGLDAASRTAAPAG